MNRPSFSWASSSPSVGRTAMQNSVMDSGSVIAILRLFLRPSLSIMLIAEALLEAEPLDHADCGEVVQDRDVGGSVRDGVQLQPAVARVKDERVSEPALLLGVVVLKRVRRKRDGPALQVRDRCRLHVVGSRHRY